MIVEWTTKLEQQLAERAESDPLLAAALAKINSLRNERDQAQRERDNIEHTAEDSVRAVELDREELESDARRLAEDLRVDAATAWARGDQVVCDTLEQAAARLQAVL